MLCQGSGKQPCTPTCRGGIAAALRPLTQPPVCRSCSRPRKPQAKSPHPSAGAFPAGSTGIAAFPQPGAGSEPLRLRGETAEIFFIFIPNRFFFFNAKKRGLEQPGGCVARVTRPVPCEHRASSTVTSPGHPTNPGGGRCCRRCLCSKPPPLFTISNPTPRFLGSDPSFGVPRCWHCPAPCRVTPHSLISSGNGKFL